MPHLPGHHDTSEAPEAHADPNQPHEFIEIDDAGIAAFAIGSGSRSGMGSIDAVVTTDNYMRKSRCGLQGCGRERSDPIHAAPEE